jgi:hypothetical protein
VSAAGKAFPLDVLRDEPHSNECLEGDPRILREGLLAD